MTLEGSSCGNPATYDKSDKTPRGKFIVLDGPDFCGKGTQMQRLVSRIMDHPLDRDRKQANVYWTREPWHSVHGRTIREILKTAKNPKSMAQELTDLYIADRREHLQTIMPLLLKGTHVVSDRYTYSTIAYQHAQGIALEVLLGRQEFFLTPDLAVILTISVQESVFRKAAERQRPYAEVFETSAKFMRAVHKNYAKLGEMMPGHPIVYVDGGKDRDTVANTIAQHVDKALFGG